MFFASGFSITKKVALSIAADKNNVVLPSEVQLMGQYIPFFMIILSIQRGLNEKEQRETRNEFEIIQLK